MAIPSTMLLNLWRVLRSEDTQSTIGIGSLALLITDETPCNGEASILILETAVFAAVRAAPAFAESGIFSGLGGVSWPEGSSVALSRSTGPTAAAVPPFTVGAG